MAILFQATVNKEIRRREVNHESSITQWSIAKDRVKERNEMHNDSQPRYRDFSLRVIKGGKPLKDVCHHRHPRRGYCHYGWRPTLRAYSLQKLVSSHARHRDLLSFPATSLSLSLSCVFYFPFFFFFSASWKFLAERKKLRQFVRRGHQKGNRVRPRVKKQPSVVPASRFTGTKRTRAFPLLAICEWVKLAVSWRARLGW